MQTTIILYDVPTQLPGGSPTSPNTWRVRLALNYKGLAYETVWVESPDIAQTCIDVGIPPLDNYPSGKPHYTLPGLIDRTNPDAPPVRLSDSFTIIQYLENTYYDPERPLYTPDTGSLQGLAHHYIVTSFSDILFPLYVVGMWDKQTPRSQVAFRFAYERRTKKKLEELAAYGDERADLWKKLRGVLDRLNGFIENNGAGKHSKFFLGDRFSFMDISVLCFLLSIHNCLGEEAKKELKDCSNGRWTRLLEDSKEYMTLR